MIFQAFTATLAQIDDPAFRGVLIKGVGLTIALLFGLFALAFWGTAWLVPETISLLWIGEVNISGTLVSWGSLILMIIASVFLMIPVASAFTGIFLDEVADAVEARHYQGLPPANPPSLAQNIQESLGFLGIILIANLLSLVLYLTPLGPFVFYILNGFLLSREYYRMVAMRRMDRATAKASYRRNLPVIWSAGILMAIPLTIPVANLIIPVLGAATFTHIFHRLNP